MEGSIQVNFNLSVMDRVHGDFSHDWDANDPVQVSNAREMFNNLKKLGYMVYETKKLAKGGGVTHEAIHNFDALCSSYVYQEPKPEQGEGFLKKVANVARQLTAHPPVAGG